MKSERLKLAMKLQMRARVTRALALLVPISMVTALVLVPWSIERIEFQQAKSDFADTWCGTFGTDAPDFDTTVAEWNRYIDRNRGFLESNWHVLGIDQWRVSNNRGPDEYRDVLMLNAQVQYWDGGWPRQWFQGFFPHHFAFFGFPHDGPPLCDQV